MLSRYPQIKYTPVKPSRHGRAPDCSVAVDERTANRSAEVHQDTSPTADLNTRKSLNTSLKPGHKITYAALFLFTVVLYARPSEFYPGPLTASIALIIGIITLAFFIPTQLSLEGNITAPLPEVRLVLLFALIGLASIPLAISPADAWHEFSGAFVRCIVIFIVLVNVVRTPIRLKALLLLTIVVSICLSVGAVNDYRLGLNTVEGYRVNGSRGGIFGNPNDMALHLVTVIPITIALCFATQRFIARIAYGVSALMMIAAITLTFSRGGFLGLLVASTFLAWKIGYRQRVTIAIVGVVVLLLLLFVAPGNYPARLASIFVPSLDPVGSAGMRRELLFRSLLTAIRHPLLGIGMGNFHIVSIHEQVTHNAYTQVAAEMGTAALVIYTMFIVAPLRKLAQVARKTRGERGGSHYYYLAVGLQASLIGYMVSSFFASVAYLWYVYYLVGYAVCLRRLYEAETGRLVVLERKTRKEQDQSRGVPLIGEKEVLTT